MTSRLCLDGRMIQSSGIGTYLRSLLDGLSARTSLSFPMTILGTPTEIPVGPWEVQSLSAPIYGLREQWAVPSAFFSAKGEILHAPHYNLPLALARRSIATVHDIIHLKFPQYLPNAAARLYAKFFFAAVVPRARAILTVSENTKRDLVERVGISPTNIHVVYPAIAPQFKSVTSEVQRETRARHKLPDRYCLFVGNLKETKNVPRLLRAYKRWRARRNDIPRLLLIGRNFIRGFEAQIATTDGVDWRGEVSAQALPEIYAAADSVVFPSLYEGFGLPALEAMASGVPLVTSRRASLPEVVDDAALLVNPESEEELSEAMERITERSELRSRLIDAGLRRAAQFSVARFAEGVLRVYEAVLSEGAL